jgi:hypothetical protein
VPRHIFNLFKKRYIKQEKTGRMPKYLSFARRRKNGERGIFWPRKGTKRETGPKSPEMLAEPIFEDMFSKRCFHLLFKDNGF